MSFQCIILDTETHTLYGLPIEIAYVPVDLQNMKLSLDIQHIYDEYFSLDAEVSIHVASMAVHHILPQDIAGKANYRQFRLPQQVHYVIGHNIDYDMDALARCGQEIGHIKRICTLAIARQLWSHLESHNLSALSYYISQDLAHTRQQLRQAHNAKADILLTAQLLTVLVQHYAIQDIEQLYQLSEQARKPTIMPFGKHKGTPLKELPANYVKWLTQQDGLDPYLLHVLRELFGYSM